MTLKSNWQHIYNKPTAYHGDYNDGIKKEPLSPYMFARWLNNNLKWHTILDFLGKNNFTDLPTYKILDMGCGNGHDLRTFCENGALPEHCYGVDFVEDCIRYSIDNSPDTMHFKVDEITKISAPDGYFHINLLMNTLSNVTSDKEIKRIQKECRRVLRPLGLLFVIVACADTPRTSSEPTLTESVNIPQRFYGYDEIPTLFNQFDLIQSRVISLGNMQTQKTMYILQ